MTRYTRAWVFKKTEFDLFNKRKWLYRQSRCDKGFELWTVVNTNANSVSVLKIWIINCGLLFHFLVNVMMEFDTKRISASLLLSYWSEQQLVILL